MNPIREFCIGYDGSSKLCCNIYFDAPDCGNMRDNSILECYFSKRFVQFRRNLFRFGEKVAPCSTCNTGIELVPESVARKCQL